MNTYTISSKDCFREAFLVRESKYLTISVRHYKQKVHLGQRRGICEQQGQIILVLQKEIAVLLWHKRLLFCRTCTCGFQDCYLDRQTTNAIWFLSVFSVMTSHLYMIYYHGIIVIFACDLPFSKVLHHKTMQSGPDFMPIFQYFSSTSKHTQIF